MKAILISIKPYWVEKILNKKKTIEIRKKFPKDYVGWVYIYCTKDKDFDLFVENGEYLSYFRHNRKFHIKRLRQEPLNGKVVARFWCDNVTEYINGGQWYDDNTFGSYDDYIKDNILEKSCLAEEELFDYCEDLAFSSIHISQLEIFEEPKDLWNFSILHLPKCNSNSCEYKDCKKGKKCHYVLAKAPQSWCYIEGVKTLC